MRLGGYFRRPSQMPRPETWTWGAGKHLKNQKEKKKEAKVISHLCDVAGPAKWSTTMSVRVAGYSRRLAWCMIDARQKDKISGGGMRGKGGKRGDESRTNSVGTPQWISRSVGV